MRFCNSLSKWYFFKLKCLHFSVTSNTYDAVIVGGGIVGCATARQLKIQKPNLKVALLEKELKLAVHQTGHNSGVLHAGIYYKPGSLKAKLCVEGIDLAYEYLEEKKIPFKRIGKLVVATEQNELPNLEGLKAIWSPHTGIVDWALVTRYYAQDFRDAGGEIFLERPLTSIRQVNNENKTLLELLSDKPEKTVYTNFLITCAGLYSDRVAEMSGCSRNPKIGKYAIFGAMEMYRSANPQAQIKLLQKYIPELKYSDVVRTGRSGVRAQALDDQGNLIEDFVFDDGQGSMAKQILHVRNAPSPGATSSISIAKMVVDKAIEKFHI